MTFETIELAFYFDVWPGYLHSVCLLTVIIIRQLLFIAASQQSASR